jgi:hypothetical protein
MVVALLECLSGEGGGGRDKEKDKRTGTDKILKTE